MKFSPAKRYFNIFIWRTISCLILFFAWKPILLIITFVGGSCQTILIAKNSFPNLLSGKVFRSKILFRKDSLYDFCEQERFCPASNDPTVIGWSLRLKGLGKPTPPYYEPRASPSELWLKNRYKRRSRLFLNLIKSSPLTQLSTTRCYLHCTENPNNVFPEMKRKTSFPIPIFMYLWAIYMFPGSACLFGCSKIGRPILGIHKTLTDTWMRKLGDRTL
jgi:hypothetical protein